MDVRITWVDPGGSAPTDEFDVLYKLADSANLNSWIIANPSPLPPGTTFYDITGLDSNTVYRFAVTKSCVGTTSFIDQVTWSIVECPVIGFYQGPPPASNRTLSTAFYSLYYPNSNHVVGSGVNIFDFTVGNIAYSDCSVPGNVSAAIVGRNTYQTVNLCAGAAQQLQQTNCNTNTLDILSPDSSLTSMVGYYGIDVSSACCNSYGTYNAANCGGFGLPTAPILFQPNRDYRFFIRTKIVDPSPNPPPDVSTSITIGDCADLTGAILPEVTIVDYAPDHNKVSGAICYDSNTCEVKVSLRDGTNQTWAPGYTYQYFTADQNLTPTLLLVDSASAALTTADITYKLYVPIKMDPALAPAQLGPNMGYNLTAYTPAPSIVHTQTGLNWTGFTWQQVVNAIVADLTANTSYIVSSVTISGDLYIKIEACNGLIEAKIEITGAVLIAPVLPDLPQTDPTTAARYGITDAFIYDSGAGDKIYASRLYNGDRAGRIVVTDITSATAAEYIPQIQLPIDKMALVPLTPPDDVYDLIHFSDNDTSYYAYTMGVAKTGAWNDGLVYICEDPLGIDISVYDQSDVLVDSFTPPATGPIRYITIDPSNGHILLLAEDSTNKFQSIMLDHSAIGGPWNILGNSLFSVNHETYQGTITGEVTYIVGTSTASSITVAPAPGWTNNQWTKYRIVVTTGALAGQQAILYDFAATGTFANDATTLYIDPLQVITFNASLLAPGDNIVLLAEWEAYSTFFDTSASWAVNQYVNYDIVMEGDGVDPYTRGKRYRVVSNTDNKMRLDGYFIGGYYNRGSANNGTEAKFLPGVNYRIYRNLCGGVVYNYVNGNFYFSIGGGVIQEIDLNGNPGPTYTLWDPAGNPIVDGAFQGVCDPITGIMYWIMRNVGLTVLGDATQALSSKDIYILNAAGQVKPAIDGSLWWDTDISGVISFTPTGLGTINLHFTGVNSRTLITAVVSLLSVVSFTTETVPSLYKKLGANEYIEGAYNIDGDAFVMINRVNNATVPTVLTNYLFTNLFIYRRSTGLVEAVLMGANSAPYGGAQGAWNLRDLGETFGEFNGFKDYGFGGMSISDYLGDRIYFKLYAEETHYASKWYDESGALSQIWCLSKAVTTTGNDASEYRLIRIFNILPDGSLVPSVRTLYWFRKNRGAKQGPTDIKYDAALGGVVGITGYGQDLIFIDPNDMTGYYGGPNYDPTLLNNITLTGNFSIVTTDPAWGLDQLDQPVRLTTNNAGKVWVFGKRPGAQVYLYKTFTAADILGPNNSFTTSVVTGQGNTAGLFNTSNDTILANYNYAPVYDPIDNKIWIMGTKTRNNPGPGNRIIRVYNASSMTVDAEIDLTTASAVPDGATGNYHNHFDIDGMNMMGFYGKTNDLLVLIDKTSYQIIYSGSVLPLVNLNRSPALTAQDFGWMVGYSNGFYVDRHPQSTTKEWWVFLTNSGTGVQYSAEVHNYLTSVVNLVGNPILNQDVTNPTFDAYTFGQYKVQEAVPAPGQDVVFWNTNFAGGGSITVNANETLELTHFHISEHLVKVENLTQGWTYDVSVPADVNKSTLPTFNTKNSIPFFAVKADSVLLVDNDILKLTIKNIVYPSCPFTLEVQVTIIP